MLTTTNRPNVPVEPSVEFNSGHRWIGRPPPRLPGSDALARTRRARPSDCAHHEEAGAAAARALLEDPDLPTAVLAGNDRCALGLLDVLTRSGIQVPEELSLIGFDDSRLSDNPRIDLTTVHRDAPALARDAVRSAVEMLEKTRTGHTDEVLEPTLVIRGTTAPPRDQRSTRVVSK